MPVETAYVINCVHIIYFIFVSVFYSHKIQKKKEEENVSHKHTKSKNFVS
jgi:hypothetical protein